MEKGREGREGTGEASVYTFLGFYLKLLSKALFKPQSAVCHRVYTGFTMTRNTYFTKCAFIQFVSAKC